MVGARSRACVSLAGPRATGDVQDEVPVDFRGARLDELVDGARLEGGVLGDLDSVFED